MPVKNSGKRADTVERILDLAETLIQTRGYNAFSYHDIAEAMRITKASIHYHFPSKADLGIAVVDRYSRRFEAALAGIGAQSSMSSLSMLESYIEPYLQFSKTPDKVCLCGALAGEMMSLPSGLRKRVDRFFKDHQSWLARIFSRGVERSEFDLPTTPLKQARLFFGALQGALLVKRTTGDGAQLRDVVDALKAQLLRSG